MQQGNAISKHCRHTEETIALDWLWRSAPDMSPTPSELTGAISARWRPTTRNPLCERQAIRFSDLLCYLRSTSARQKGTDAPALMSVSYGHARSASGRSSTGDKPSNRRIEMPTCRCGISAGYLIEEHGQANNVSIAIVRRSRRGTSEGNASSEKGGCECRK